MSFNINRRWASYYLISYPYRPYNFLNHEFKRSLAYPCSRRSLDVIGERSWNIATRLEKICDMKIEIFMFVKWKCEVDHPSRLTG